jgi:putative membrane protein
MANRLYETAARQSEDPEVRDFAVRSLPGVAQRLAMGRALQRDPPAGADRTDRIQPPVKGEAPAVSPASREAPASIAPAAK